MLNKLYVSYGQKAEQMVRELLEKINLASLIPAGSCIGLKPNLVVARPSEEGATTSPKLVEGVIQYLQDHGFQEIVIAEGSWVGDRTTRAFEVCGYTDLSTRYGVKLIDLQRDSYHSRSFNDLSLNICDTMNDIDYLINFPVLKGHCQTKITGALKNLKGCIPDTEKRRFHTMGLHQPIAYLNKLLKTDLVIVDGLIGDLDFEEGGNPVQMDRIILGADPVLVDSYHAELLGYAAEDIPYIIIASELGVGRLFDDTTIVEEFNVKHSTTRIKPTRAVEYYARYVKEKEACSACYGSLIHALARLENQNSLKNLHETFRIGQGYKGKIFDDIGVGNCCKDFYKYVVGCPPSAKNIMDYLKNIGGN